jgi:hypothetical protein
MKIASLLFLSLYQDTTTQKKKQQVTKSFLPPDAPAFRPGEEGGMGVGPLWIPSRSAIHRSFGYDACIATRSPGTRDCQLHP